MAQKIGMLGFLTLGVIMIIHGALGEGGKSPVHILSGVSMLMAAGIFWVLNRNAAAAKKEQNQGEPD